MIPNAGSEPKLRTGVSVSVTVLERDGPGVYRILVDGRVLSARSEASLVPGSRLTARVERFESQLILRLGPDPRQAGCGLGQGLDAPLVAAGLPTDLAGRRAVQALLAEGQKASADALFRLRKATGFSGDGTSLEKRLALAAQLEAKGLGATEEALDLLEALECGDSTGEGFAEGEGPSDGQGGREDPTGDDAFQAAAKPQGTGESLAPAELDSLAIFLKKLCAAASQSVDEGTLDPGSRILGLFNHARATGRNWILVPFRFTMDSVEFTGSFRILLPYMPGGPGCLIARFVTRCERPGDAREDSGAAWGFSLDFGSTKRRLVLNPGLGRKLPDRVVRDLGKSLAASGCELAIGKADGAEPSGKLDFDAQA